MATWTIKTYHKKNCQEVEHWSQDNGDGRITVTNGYRYGEWTVETTDDNPPEFEFTEVPGGNGKRDSIDMYNCQGSNIESVDLVEMFDGGCWYDVEIEGLDDEAEEEIQEFLDENSTWDLEDREQDPWHHSDTECWVWGPIEISNTVSGERVRIICADADGNVVDFKEED